MGSAYVRRIRTVQTCHDSAYSKWGLCIFLRILRIVCVFCCVFFVFPYVFCVFVCVFCVYYCVFLAYFFVFGKVFIFCVFLCVFSCIFCVFFAYFGYLLHVLRISVRILHISLRILRMFLRILNILRIAFCIFCILVWVSFCSAAAEAPEGGGSCKHLELKFSSFVVWVEALMCSRILNTQQAGQDQLAGAAARGTAARSAAWAQLRVIRVQQQQHLHSSSCQTCNQVSISP